MKKSKLDRMIGMMKEFETVFSSLKNENLRRYVLKIQGIQGIQGVRVVDFIFEY
jgi:transcriptional regulator of aromatic amino acid metabolism